jgi:hypothetical protein
MCAAKEVCSVVGPLSQRAGRVDKSTTRDIVTIQKWTWSYSERRADLFGSADAGLLGGTLAFPWSLHASKGPFPPWIRYSLDRKATRPARSASLSTPLTSPQLAGGRVGNPE